MWTFASHRRCQLESSMGNSLWPTTFVDTAGTNVVAERSTPIMMEVAHDLSTVFDQPIVRLDKAHLRRLNPRQYPFVATTIDRIGKLSSEAQGIKKTQLTSYEKLLDSEYEFALYLFWKKSRQPGHSVVIGLLKVAYRQLYLYDSKNEVQCVQPLSILDFYVFDTMQRRGNGYTMFTHMLSTECKRVEECAIDKPSPQLLNFMQKYFGLKEPLWQMNNFVVYPAFFEILKNPQWQSSYIPCAPCLPVETQHESEAAHTNNGNGHSPDTPLSTDSLQQTTAPSLLQANRDRAEDGHSMSSIMSQSQAVTPVRMRRARVDSAQGADTSHTNMSQSMTSQTQSPNNGKSASRQALVKSLGHQSIW